MERGGWHEQRFIMRMVGSIPLRVLLYYCVAVVATALDSNEPRLPELIYNVSQSSIWTCLLSSPQVVQLVHSSRNMVFLHSTSDTITVLASTQNFRTDGLSIGLQLCNHVVHTSSMLERVDELGVKSQLRKRRDTSPVHALSNEWFKSYHNLSAIYHWYHMLADQYPDLVQIVDSIGRTHQGRDIMAVHITDQVHSSANRPKLYLQCLLHPREWISGPVCMYTALSLVTASGNDKVADMLKKVEFIIVPVVNPDGYYLTWLQYPKYRFWRKNLANVAANSQCSGVDLNRNFNDHWSEHGTSADRCSEVYQGTSPGSEPEVQSVVQYLKSNTPVIGAIDFHSFSQIIVYPYGWTKSSPVNGERLRYLAEEFARNIHKVNAQSYTAHQMGSIYLASGTFTDWFFSDDFQQHNKDQDGSRHFAVPLTVELRPRDNQLQNSFTSFMVPPSEVLPTCQEIYPAVIEFTRHLLSQQRTIMK